MFEQKIVYPIHPLPIECIASIINVRSEQNTTNSEIEDSQPTLQLKQYELPSNSILPNLVH